jgi:hypothetical protein
MSKIFEVVTGQILLSSRSRFFELHKEVLLPIMKEVGITPKLLLITEVGRYGRFLDIYEYENWHDYERKTSELIKHKSMDLYYQDIGRCVDGSIQVEIMTRLPYAEIWEVR